MGRISNPPSSLPPVNMGHISNPPSSLPPVKELSLLPMNASSTNPTVKTTNDVAKDAIPKLDSTTQPQSKKRKFKLLSFAESCWKRMVKFFKSIFNIKSVDSQTDPLSASTNLTTQLSLRLANSQTDLLPALKELASQLSPKVLPELNLSDPKGQVNITGANCYMNAGLQNLEIYNLQYDENCRALVCMDLSMEANETFKDLEKRMQSWSPIIDPKDVDVKNWDDEIVGLGNDLPNLAKDQVNKKMVINGQIEKLKYQKFEVENPSIPFEKRVAFKWSYLLVLQAKAFGDDSDIKKALEIHHSAVFDLNNPLLPWDERRSQMDASDYLTLFHTVLGSSFNQLSYKSSDLEGLDYVSSTVTFDPTPIIAMNIRHDSGDGIVGNSKSLKQCLSRYFASEVKYSTREGELNSSLKELQGQLASKPTDKELLNKINKTNMDLLKITGGEFTRTEGENKGQIVTMNSIAWKPEEGVSFKDWRDNRLIMDNPKDFMQISLNRFFTDETGKNQHKIRDEISFDLDENNKPVGSFTDPLDLAQYFAPEVLDDRGAKYELIGMTCHEGSTIKSGHYIAYVKKGDQWFCMNDGTVSKKRVDEVPFNKASAFTYRRL